MLLSICQSICVVTANPTGHSLLPPASFSVRAAGSSLPAWLLSSFVTAEIAACYPLVGIKYSWGKQLKGEGFVLAHSKVSLSQQRNEAAGAAAHTLPILKEEVKARLVFASEQTAHWFSACSTHSPGSLAPQMSLPIVNMGLLHQLVN